MEVCCGLSGQNCPHGDHYSPALNIIAQDQAYRERIQPNADDRPILPLEELTLSGDPDKDSAELINPRTLCARIAEVWFDPVGL